MASEADLKLLGTAVSPFAVRIRMALHMKGLPYEYLEQDLVNKSDLLVTSNPVYKKVPVLIHGGKPILESLAIVQYIDEVWSGKALNILPADPYQRATARFWAAYADDKLFAAYLGIFGAVTEVDRAEQVGETLAAVEQLEGAFIQSSNGKAFFAGDSVGFLDLVVGCHLFWLEAMGKMAGVAFLDTGKTPLLAAWAERFGETEVAKEAVPDADVVVEYAKKRQAAAAN
ncbi:probable glutathione S-transferase GSTU6 [Brachypodium distachyon]|uniref:Glutathione S-transferase n=1 Tax=Brachypodium distachyon TaxID=15368 RepID=I1I5M1_BRADI|nr:probable glutathione S-transferase GSTU6 [Brachypodium distachyon]KQJ97558.1 hypothetical protein BRADI_3g31841v3 [Brachypodium distachyon]|eukprot:XP_003574234.1 probable glutathione S-transferase GSTU6 [Brachypodium distachyon]